MDFTFLPSHSWLSKPTLMQTRHATPQTISLLHGITFFSWQLSHLLAKPKTNYCCSIQYWGKNSALTDTTTEFLWLHWLLQDLGDNCSTTPIVSINMHSYCPQWRLSWAYQTYWDWLSLFWSSFAPRYPKIVVLFPPKTNWLTSLLSLPHKDSFMHWLLN